MMDSGYLVIWLKDNIEREGKEIVQLYESSLCLIYLFLKRRPTIRESLEGVLMIGCGWSISDSDSKYQQSKLQLGKTLTFPCSVWFK